MTSSTGAFQGKLWKICVVDLQQGLACLCWAGELSPRQSAARAGAARARLGLAGSRAGRANVGQAGAGARWLGSVRMGRLGLGYGQAGARLWAGKAGWGRLWLGQMGRLGLGYGQAWLWAGKAGWGRLGLGYGQVRQAVAWSNGQAGARLWAGKAGWGWLGLGPNGQLIPRTDCIDRGDNQNCFDRQACVDRVMLISKGTHQGREQAMVWLTAEYQEQMQAQKVIARERGKGQSDRQAGHTHTQAEGNRATESIKTEGRPRIEENPPKGKTPPGKETSVKDGFKGKTPLAGKGNTVNFE
ncbi:hypothetical protein PPACK8108_LOCUS9500 [Phakopsora pachyrhizi]|uniref:Uncharacterized protein n=1 Tax=Phakopsora pachyrhizi TaxID=170000 RepID=A0AAV0AWN5_PHAPC|nr:hypothetical protein PPACK8108_LOCUS9500 [Phakopsora pachyrhizi]